MATINDIVNLDSEKGDIASGGGNAGALNINTQPLEQLGLYTNFYNQTLYRQTIQDRDAKLAQVAKISDIDANNLFGKDKEYLVKKLNNLRDFAVEYAKNPNLTIADQLKWQTALSDVNNDYLSGKQRALTYQTRLNDINTNYSGDQKDIKLKELNNDFQNTDIATQLSTGTGYKPVQVNLPNPATLTLNTLKNGANQVVDVKSTVYNPQANAALAQTSVLGLNSVADGLKGTEAELQQTADGEAQHWAGMTDTFNSVLTSKNVDGSYKYFDANGAFLADKFKTDNASNTAIMQPYNALVNLNNYSTQKKQELANGIYTDRGIQYQAPTSLTPDMFNAGIIKFTPNGVTKEQLAQGGIFQKYLGDTVSKTFKETNKAIQQQKANAESSNAALGWKKLDLDKDKWKATQTAGTEDMKSSALAKAQRIYDELKNLADSNGVISPDKVRQLNAEQLKYLGGVKSTTDALGKTTTGYSPLDASGQTAIELKNGQIKVMRPANNGTSIGRTVTGGYSGQFDNKSSTNITNIATNILNEQLKNAGSKELSSYAPIDYATNTDSGGTQSSTTTQTKGLADPTLDTNVNNWKALGNGNYQYIDGSIYNSKGKKIK